MKKPKRDALRADPEKLAMHFSIARFELDAHFTLIGKAACDLLAQGHSIGRDSLADAIGILFDTTKPDLARRAVQHLDHTSPTS